jgi:hypothetical protein
MSKKTIPPLHVALGYANVIDADLVSRVRPKTQSIETWSSC